MNVALVLAGGRGTRIGGEIPKQYIEVNGVPVISYCLSTLIKHPLIDAIQIVAEEEYQELIAKEINVIAGEVSKRGVDADIEKLRGFSSPGANRQESILNGLKDIRKYTNDDDKVLVHDAARPFLSDKLINNCFVAIEGHDGVLPTLPMKDTVYICNGENKITALIDRSTVFNGQAPELFVIGKYYDANVSLGDNIYKINGSTEPAIMAGMDVVTIRGEEDNFKVTTNEDMEKMLRMIEKQFLEEQHLM